MINQEQLQSLQDELNDLCKKHGVAFFPQPWNEPPAICESDRPGLRFEISVWESERG